LVVGEIIMKEKAIILFIVIMFSVQLRSNEVNFIPMDHPILWETAEVLSLEEITSPEMQQLANQMIDYMKDRKNEGKEIYGLSAPQIGISKRVIVIDMNIGDDRKTPFSKYEVFFNPVIQWKSNVTVLDQETCLSTGNIAAPVRRSIMVKFFGYDRNANLIFFTFHDLLARVAQHQVDHLEGIRFPELVEEGNGVLHWVEPQEINRYKVNWHIWEKEVTFDDWKNWSNAPIKEK